MDLKNLLNSLESNSIITKDVNFVFNNQFLGESVKLPAHKVILSIASDVFKTQFYGNLKEPSDEITIVDASHEAFKLMVEYIYHLKQDWESKDLSIMAEVFYLGEKYQLEDLKLEVVEAVLKCNVDRSNFLEVASMAEKQLQHTNLSKSLYTIAAKFLQKEFKGDIKEVLKLFSEVEADSSDPTNSFILHKLMTALSTLSPISLCQNCKSNACLHDKEPTRLNFVAGAKIKIIGGKNYHDGINPVATLERVSCSKGRKFIGKKVTGYIACYFGDGSYVYMCKWFVRSHRFLLETKICTNIESMLPHAIIHLFSEGDICSRVF